MISDSFAMLHYNHAPNWWCQEMQRNGHVFFCFYKFKFTYILMFNCLLLCCVFYICITSIKTFLPFGRGIHRSLASVRKVYSFTKRKIVWQEITLIIWYYKCRHVLYHSEVIFVRSSGIMESILFTF